MQVENNNHDEHSDKVQHLNRAQKRELERRNAEAFATKNRLLTDFEEFLIYEKDLSEADVRDKILDLSNRWKFYCKRRNIKTEFYTVIQTECDTIYKQYLNPDEQQPAADDNNDDNKQGEGSN